MADPMNDLLGDEMTIAEPQFIVVPQRQRPTAAAVQVADLLEEAIEALGLPVGDGGEEMGREGEIKGRMQFPIFEVRHGLLHRLDRFRQQQDVATRMVCAEGVNPLAQGFQEGVGFR